jgi:hypothetical protein
MLRGDYFIRNHLFRLAGAAAFALGFSTAAPSGALAQQCAPPCRAGFMCHKGQCVSVCNPPCEANEMCTAGGECVPKQAEPPAPPPQAQPGPHAPSAPGQPAPYGQPAPAGQPGGWGAPPPQQAQGAWGQPAGPPAPPRPTMDLSDKAQFYGGLHLRFKGKFSNDELAFGSWPLDPTIGVLLGVDFGVSKYLALGPRLAFGAWRPHAPLGFEEADRNFDVDIGFSLRPRVPIPLNGAYLEAYVAIVNGFTAGFLPEVSRNNFTPGFHVGVLPGMRAFFTEQIGVFFEIGFMHHSTWWNDDFDGQHIKRNQGVMNTGVVTAF